MNAKKDFHHSMRLRNCGYINLNCGWLGGCQIRISANGSHRCCFEKFMCLCKAEVKRFLEVICPNAKIMLPNFSKDYKCPFFSKFLLES
jgi:hypothetical protein